MNAEEIVKTLKRQANPQNVAGMVRFGINPANTLGISVYTLRAMAKKLGKNHKLALDLWDTKVHEARLLAGFVDDPQLVTEKQMELWVKDFDSWDICDQVCSNLFDKTSYAYKKAFTWAERKEEFVKRAGFVLMAALSVHDKDAKSSTFLKFFPLIKKHSVDERNFVKKAVNWALRQIGKRNIELCKKAMKLSLELKQHHSRAARWVGNDAYRELSQKIKLLKK